MEEKEAFGIFNEVIERLHRNTVNKELHFLHTVRKLMLAKERFYNNWLIIDDMIYRAIKKVIAAIIITRIMLLVLKFDMDIEDQHYASQQYIVFKETMLGAIPRRFRFHMEGTGIKVFRSEILRYMVKWEIKDLYDYARMNSPSSRKSHSTVA
jgi:hypothetical protein